MNKHAIGTEWITTEQAAELTGYTTVHIRRLAREDRFDTLKVGNTWLLRRADVLKHYHAMEALGSSKYDPTRKDHDA
jgi:excisionase family DNA binding protein